MGNREPEAGFSGGPCLKGGQKSNTFLSCFLFPPYRLKLTRGSSSLQAQTHSAINRVRRTRNEEVDRDPQGFCQQVPLSCGCCRDSPGSPSRLRSLSEHRRMHFRVHTRLPPSPTVWAFLQCDLDMSAEGGSVFSTGLCLGWRLPVTMECVESVLHRFYVYNGKDGAVSTLFMGTPLLAALSYHRWCRALKGPSP